MAACLGHAQMRIQVHPELNFRIVNQKAVRSELKLDEKQGKAVDDLVARMQEKYQVRIEGGGDQAEIEKQIKEQFAAADKEIVKGLRESLTQDQFKRFEELNLQSLGIGALFIDRVQTALSLSDAQKKAAEEENGKVDEFMMGLATQTTGDNGEQQTRIEPNKEQRKKLRDLREKGLAAVVAAFSEGQKKKWTEMVGKKFEFDD